ncbi:MAG: transglycosylase SLT domain-containing protein [Deltaproteobacteria bacterium]|nr:transglycosylase SLT domain-containing protein [Deltaproteobacteria bacterium]
MRCVFAFFLMVALVYPLSVLGAPHPSSLSSNSLSPNALPHLLANANSPTKKTALELLQAGKFLAAAAKAKTHDTAEARLLRAVALERANKLYAATLALVGLEKALPHLADTIYLMRGELQMKRKRFKAAAVDFKRCVESAKSRWVDRCLEGRAQALTKMRHYRAAEKSFASLLKSYPDHPQAPTLNFAHAKVLLKIGRLKSAAKLLQRIWLEYPTTSEASKAARLLKRSRRLRRWAPKLGPEKLYDRAHVLYRAKRFDAAIAQLKVLSQRHPKLANKSRFKIAHIQIKADREKAALATLKPLLKGKSRAWRRIARRKAARALARLGHLDQGVALYKPDIPAPASKKVHGVARKAMSELAVLLASYAEYDKARALYARLAKLQPRSKELARRLAWTTYRAGRHDEAIALLAKAYGKSRFSRYWQARAHANAGRKTAAENLYKQLVEQNLRDYYGHIARSRLVEMGKVKLAAQACKHTRGVTREALLPTFDKARKLAGPLLPGLDRVASLWQAGLPKQAKRELKAALLDYAWAVYRNARSYRIRQRPLRVWMGGPAKRPAFRSARAKALRKLKLELQPVLSTLAYAAGFDYLGWRLGPRDSRSDRQHYPRAYAPLINEISKRKDLDPNLVWAIMRTESVYRPDVISRVNAAGLMQLMPQTARRLAEESKRGSFKPDDVFDPRANLELAGHYLQAVSRKLSGQVPLIAAGYNGGPHNVARWLDARGKKCTMDEFIEEIPYDESRRYAKKIVRLKALYERVYCDKDDQVLSNTLVTRYLAYPNY